MLHSKLIILYQSLSKYEVNSLEKFVYSPFLNKHEAVQKLFDYLKKQSEFNEENLAEKKVWKSIFGEKKYDKIKLRYVRSYLLKTIESFLALSEWQQDELQQLKYLAQNLRKRGNGAFFQSIISRSAKMRQTQTTKNVFYHRTNYEWELEQFSWMEQRNRRGEMNQQQLLDSLDIAFIAEKLKQACTILSHETVYKTQYDYGLLEVILKFVNQPKYLSIPAISIYYWSYLALKNPTIPTYFQQVKKEIQDYAHLFTISEGRDVYLLAINYCIRQINIGNKSYVKELFELYKQGIEKKALMENGILARWTYKNVVAIGLGLKAYDWIKNFIYQYKPYLHPEFRESMFSLNLAEWHYHQKKYNTAIDLLVKMKEQDALIQMSAKTLLAKIYYDLEEERILSSFLHSFELYVRRQKSIGYHQKNYLNFIRFLKKLLTLNFYDKKAILKLQKNIIEMKILPEKEWLLGKLDEII